ncbi:ATP-binding protein [Candidatus Gracilibacteria bacterium]|nr:ATP-binding protein [Candidatus Gracilibacteria bacterium]
MIKPDWDIFKAKFSENPQDNFEWLCYILFCKEFGKEKGIFRFKNQSGMETNPVKIGDNYISWEAKFYTTDDKLSSNKEEFKKKIDISQSKNPELTQLYFYTPIDWTETSSKSKRKTKEQEEVEEYAKNKNIEVVWKGAWFFESPFVCIENEKIAEHFFSNDKSIFDLIGELRVHAENIFMEIQTNIVFNSHAIEIDRNKELSSIKDTKQQVIVLSGSGGAGKTALIKNLYQEIREKFPFYLFKATEFELRTINDFLKNFNFQEFINVHQEDGEKIIVIDSAEKLLELKNTAPFKEILSILTQNNWKIIFTTRDNYLEDLNYLFFEIYKIIPSNISIQNLDKNQLQGLSKQYFFQLPKDEKLFELIRNPFYLAEYLRYYKADEVLNYEVFKSELWKKTITKAKPPRSECFQKISLLRSNKGSFFVTPEDCESIILNELVGDGILGYEDDKGYFITHDIYEEWALEKIIKKEFSNKESNQSFFDKIGQSLSIRRSFRNWISEQLLLEKIEIRNFIEEVIGDDAIDQSWKNEILVSILLSDYSDYFFNNFKDLLLANKQELLKKATFWLRIACKEIDNDFFNQLGIKDVDLSTIKYVLTKPKGTGWESIIKFVYDNLKTIGIENIYFIMPVIHDWNSKFKNGETTRLSSLIALQYYKWLIDKSVYFSREDDVKDNLFQTILYGSSEIKDELKVLFEEILNNKWKNHSAPFYELSKTILTKLEGFSLVQVLPEYILQLANLFWTYTPDEKDGWHSDSGMGVEQYFQIEDDHLDYFPASSYQTPIYWLIQSAQKETIDFILEFTNKSVEAFSKSQFAKYEVKEVEVLIDNKTTIRQYISNRLWCTYRGTQVAPHVLESMHMALEKFFLERGEKTKSETLEYWLIYLLKNSKSASISAVVTSIVLAFPDKTFNVAKVLFQTKEFFLYETSRWVLDQGQKSQLLMLKDSFGINSKNEIYENERLKACDAKHRGWHLENLFLQYQVFKNGNITEEQVKERQGALWEVLDNYYKELPDEEKQTESDQTWRMFLARMDYRKMKLSTKETEEGTEIHFNPEIEPKLKEISEESVKRSSTPMQYTSLKMWAYYRIKNEDEYKKYEQYEKNPKLVLKEIKEIISKLKVIKKPQHLQFGDTEDESFYLFNYSIPGEVCSVLIRDLSDKISQREINFCKDIVLEVASSSLKPNYQYQISDGLESAISVLPVLIKQFPKEKNRIKIILLLTLFDDHPIGMGGGKFNHYSINAVHKLWKDNFQDAQSLLFGYLLLKPKYEELRQKLREENHKKGIYSPHEAQPFEKFIEEYESDLQKLLENKITREDCKDIKEMKLSSLRTAFQVIPLKTENEDHKKIVEEIISTFAEELTSDDKDDKIDYMIKYDFFKKLAYFVLSSGQEEIEGNLKPFIDNFNNSEIFADLFEQFILAEDQLNAYSNFWMVWKLFKEKIIGICKDGDSYWYTEKIVRNYLFATVKWPETTTSWHTLKDENKDFFKEMSQKIGHCPSTFYSILKLLTDIGSIYLDEGVLWVSNMLRANKDLFTAKLEVNTIYYLENNIRKYIYNNRELVRKNKQIKEGVLVMLDFLIEKGSVIGYILKENIL